MQFAEGLLELGKWTQDLFILDIHWSYPTNQTLDRKYMHKYWYYSYWQLLGGDIISDTETPNSIQNGHIFQGSVAQSR